MRRLPAIFVLIFCLSASAAEVMPPAPENHFNDYANVVPKATAEKLNTQLADFERQTSNQIVVAVYPKMQSDSSIEDYSTRIFTNWKVGQKGKNNGAVLFVFIQDHKMFIVTGYGLEGALPDALCKQIIEQEIKPAFQRGDYAAGLTAGINAMLAATRGEYKGNGNTVGGAVGKTVTLGMILAPFIIILVLAFLQRATMYGGRGRSGGWFWGPLLLNMMMNSGRNRGDGGSWGGGGSWSGGGGGTFSGGGGMTGGGGAGGNW